MICVHVEVERNTKIAVAKKINIFKNTKHVIAKTGYMFKVYIGE